jgi:hypothetical protein
MLAYACNPRYLASGDWEDQGLRQAQAKSSQDPMSTNSWVQWRCRHPAMQKT